MLAVAWTAEEPWFDLWQSKEIFLKTVQTDSGPHQSSSPLGTSVLSLLGEANHSPPSGAKVKNALSHL